MAKQPSKKSGRGKAQEDTAASEDTTAGEPAEDGTLGGDTVLVGDTTIGDDSVAQDASGDSNVTLEPGETLVPVDDDAEPDLSRTEIVDDAETAAATTAEAAPTPPAPAPIVEQKGPGFGALLLGGIVAGAIGYAAAFFGLNPGNDTSDADAALAAAMETIEGQSAAITALEAQVAELAAVEPPQIPEVDLSGVEGAIASVGETASANATAMDALTGRVTALEERPVFTGEVDEDSAAMAAAVEALEARLSAEREAAAEAQAAAEAAQAAAAAQVEEASATAQAAIAEAEARAQEVAAATQAQAALSRVQIAVASGAPFADALADLNVDIPEGLSAAADTGVPTLEALQAAFPPLARAALTQAIQENADDSAGGRFGAFLSSQFAGRSVERREGQGPDAVLSRAEDDVRNGQLDSALTEIESLPPDARALLEDWAAQVRLRAAADAGLSELAATLDN